MKSSKLFAILAVLVATPVAARAVEAPFAGHARTRHVNPHLRGPATTAPIHPLNEGWRDWHEGLRRQRN